MNYKKDSVYYDARAKIMWGKPREEVHEWLEEQGLARCEIVAMLDDCMAERANDVRIEGTKKAIVWSAALVGCIVLHCVFWYVLGWSTTRVMAACVIGGAISFYRAVDGIVMVVRGGRINGSLTEIRD